MSKTEVFGAAFIDCTQPGAYINPLKLKHSFRRDSLFWFLIKGSDIFKIQPKILKDFRLAFRVVWVYPFNLLTHKKQRDTYFLFAVYKDTTYFFNKDPIREKHIWKDVEWGGRTKNYNPKGKDPGTVWIKIIDDGKAHTVAHEPLSPAELIQRVRSSSLKSKKEKLLVVSSSLKKNVFKL